MEYTNAQILAAVVTEWARPAISQIAASKLLNISPIRSLQNTIIGSGLVGQNYSIANEIAPFVNNAMNSLATPMLAKYFGNVPDETLPALAHSIVDTAMQQPKFSILDGLVEFDQDDMIELKDLLDKNLPISTSTEEYHIIK